MRATGLKPLGRCEAGECPPAGGASGSGAVFILLGGKGQQELEDVTAYKRGIIFAALDGKNVEKPGNHSLRPLQSLH